MSYINRYFFLFYYVYFCYFIFKFNLTKESQLVFITSVSYYIINYSYLNFNKTSFWKPQFATPWRKKAEPFEKLSFSHLFDWFHCLISPAFLICILTFSHRFYCISQIFNMQKCVLERSQPQVHSSLTAINI